MRPTHLVDFRYYIDGEFLVSFPDPPINEDPDWEGFGEFGAPWNDGHPWGTDINAPFDRDVKGLFLR